MSSEQNCIFTRCFYQVDLPALSGSNQVRKGWILTLLNLKTNLPEFITYFNQKFGTSYNIETKTLEIYESLRMNMNHCFPNSNFLNFNFIEDEEKINAKFYQKVYAFLLDENLNLISSISVHFFRQEYGQQWYSKIYDVCAAPNQTGTKILMLNILDKIKPISETIWLNVLPNNTKAYNLYLDIGFEFVFNNKTDLLDMIYVEKNITSSRGNDVLMTQRQNIINDMVNYKIYRNYIKKIGDKSITALRCEFYECKEEHTEEEKRQIILTFMEHVYDFLNPSYKTIDEDMKTEGYKIKDNRLQPVLVFTKNKIQNYLFINSLVNNTENFNKKLESEYSTMLLSIFYKTNIKNEDLEILVRTLFPVKTTVTITNENPLRTYIHNQYILNLNLFVIINQFEVQTYNYPHIVYKITGDIYNIDIDTLERINEIDLYVKYALSHNVEKICVRIPKNIEFDLRRLYYMYNLLPSYSACPYNPHTFVYNIKRFNNINNTYWELDNFDFNNLYVLPNSTLEQQPITKTILETISGCSNLSDSLDNYFTSYLEYIKPSTSSFYKIYFQDKGKGIILSFLGYLIMNCNKNFIDQMMENNKLNGELTEDKLERWVQNTPFFTLNYYDFDRIKPDLIHNINIFCYSRIVDFMSSSAHGAMLPNVYSLERGQKLIMYTKPNTLFYMSNLNLNFVSLIFDVNNIQRLFDCIELLNNDNISVNTYFNQYRDIIQALLANNSYTDNDIFLYTQSYYDHSLTYNQEVTFWVNYPLPIYQHYHGSFAIINARQIRLTGNIDRTKINTKFSLDGLYVNFNTDNNSTTNRVYKLDNTTLTVTLTEDIPFGASSVIIGSLPYQYQYQSIKEFYINIINVNEFNNCNKAFVIEYLVREDGNISNYNPNYTNNFERNGNIILNLSNNLFNRLNSDQSFVSNSNLSVDLIRTLSQRIIFRKNINRKNHVYEQPLSIQTNSDINLNNNFIKTNTHNQYIKQYTNQDISINLKTLLDYRLKYNSFVCCRGVEGVNAQVNLPPLPGEIKVRDIIKRKLSQLIQLPL